MEINQILDWIAREPDEDELTALNNAIKLRREILVNQATATLRRGSRVTITGISPKSLEGAIGTIAGISRTRAEVTLDPENQPRGVHFARFSASVRNGLPLRVPIKCLRPYSA